MLMLTGGSMRSRVRLTVFWQTSFLPQLPNVAAESVDDTACSGRQAVTAVSRDLGLVRVRGTFRDLFVRMTSNLSAQDRDSWDPQF